MADQYASVQAGEGLLKKDYGNSPLEDALKRKRLKLKDTKMSDDENADDAQS